MPRASEQTEPLKFYHVCLNDDAKWFSKESRSACPRCGQEHESREKLKPPWIGEEKPLLTVKDVAERLSFGKSTIYEMVERNEIPHRKIRKSIRFTEEDVQELLERTKEGRGPAVRVVTKAGPRPLRHFKV